MDQKDIQLSKALSWILRHGAIKEKLPLSSEGYIDVDTLLKHKNFIGKYNVDDIKRVVTTNNKQRFSLRNSGVSGKLEIKANQGHSIEINDDSDLKPVTKESYSTVIHGTYLKCWPEIKAKGISRMSRRHIHLSKGLPQDKNVVSGMRADCEVYIYIDVGKAIADGITFYESVNGVILTPGNTRGYLEQKYFVKAVLAKTGALLDFTASV